MDILNKKYVPLKIFVSRKNKELRIAWHWRRSITWRWISTYRLCRSKAASSKFDNGNGHGWLYKGFGRLGEFRFSWQPNMPR